MITQEVARKYARALFLATKDKGLVDQAYEQFHALKVMLASDRRLIGFLEAPKVAEEQKIELIRNVFGQRFEALFVEFLVVLVQKKRSGFLSDIIDQFERLVESDKGIARAVVTTALPLNEQEEQRLIAQLAAKTGLKIDLRKRVDPSIIGGMIVIIQNEIIDGSISHTLERIEEQLGRVRVY